MLDTNHTTATHPSLADTLASRWERSDGYATWEWMGSEFFMPRAPEIIAEAIGNSSIVRTAHLRNLVGPGVATTSGSAWKEGRRTVRDILGGPQVPAFLACIHEPLEERISAMDAAAEAGRPVDIYYQATHAAVGSFTKFVFGTALNDEEFGKLFASLKPLMVLSNALAMGPSTTGADLLQLQKQASRTTQTLAAVLETAQSRTSADDDRTAAPLRLLLDAERDGKFQSTSLFSQITNLVFGSFLTTSTTVALCVSEAIRSPGIWNQLADEALQGPFDASVRCAEDLGLPLATAAIDETLRLFPPIWHGSRLADANTSLGGHRISEGTIVPLFLLGAGRDERSWEDPLLWKPERFLPGAPVPIEGSYEPFLSGKHLCLGRRFARLEGTHMVSALAQRYRITPSSAAPIALSPHLFLFPADPVEVHLTRR